MSSPNDSRRDTEYLRQAARLAIRGHGRVEPNPLVGCLIVDDYDDEIVGWGYHRKFGDAHAEIEALRRAGDRASGATCFVTLEPCSHTGKTGPCADALIEAGVRRVVIGRRDSTAEAAGGAERLADAGVDVCICDHDLHVHSVTEPFFHRVATKRPWVVAKWAQTLDGRIATRTGDSQWISSARSRAMVHRQRGRVDIILTGIGSVLHDDPLLTARCRTVRRTARRVVIDADLEIPIDSKLVQTANQTPVVVFCTDDTLAHRGSRASALRDRGVAVIACSTGDQVALDRVIDVLAEQYSAATVLVEAGAGLLGRLFEQSLINEAWVFIGPQLLGDELALPVARGRVVQHLIEGVSLKLLDHRRRGDDVMVRYVVRRSTI